MHFVSVISYSNKQPCFSAVWADSEESNTAVLKVRRVAHRKHSSKMCKVN